MLIRELSSNTSIVTADEFQVIGLCTVVNTGNTPIVISFDAPLLAGSRESTTTTTTSTETIPVGKSVLFTFDKSVTPMAVRRVEPDIDTINANDITSGSIAVANITDWGSTPQHWFKGVLSSDLTLTSGSDNVINWNSNIDPHNWYSSNKITPKKAGWYQVIGRIMFAASGISSSNQINSQIIASGSQVCICQSTNNQYNGQTQVCHAFVYLNGTTDYLELTAYTTINGQKISGNSSGSLTSISVNWISS